MFVYLITRKHFNGSGAIYWLLRQYIFRSSSEALMALQPLPLLKLSHNCFGFWRTLSVALSSYCDRAWPTSISTHRYVSLPAQYYHLCVLDSLPCASMRDGNKATGLGSMTGSRYQHSYALHSGKVGEELELTSLLQLLVIGMCAATLTGKMNSQKSSYGARAVLLGVARHSVGYSTPPIPPGKTLMTTSSYEQSTTRSV